jgi:excisionase family DNA binding protein
LQAVAPPRLLTVRAAARLLGISERTFHRWVRDGRIAGAKLERGGWTLYNEADVLTLKRDAPTPPRGGRRLRVVEDRGDQLQLLTVDQAEQRGVLDQAAAAAMRAAAQFAKPHQLRLVVTDGPEVAFSAAA